MKISQYLVSNEVDETKIIALSDSKLLDLSLRFNYSRGIMELINRGYDFSRNNNSAIRLSVEYGSVDVVEILLSIPTVDPSALNNHAIFWSSYSGKFGIVKLLLADSRVDPTVSNNLTIRVAHEKKQYDIVDALLQDKGVLSKLTKEQIKTLKHKPC